ncbi:MAG: D-alanyl-D-alanine carboxypeptidase DacC [Gammaproteobacteria bacterium]|nr:D-alanyl-D-alanine carboxypeptidase DacC [Gammaproteobacteria bacterium]
MNLPVSVTLLLALSLALTRPVGAVENSSTAADPATSPAPAPPLPPAAPATIIPAPPALAARAWILVDFDSGAVLAEANADARVEPASITKIMTIYSVSQLLKAGRIKLTDPVPISAKARSMTGSRMFVEQGAKVTLEDLMKGDIIQSGNDASVALAEYAAGSEEVFASLMNRNAASLGMTATHFVNSTGLPDPDHYTTARDLSRAAVALIRDHPDVYRWFSIREFTYHGITQPNRNKLLWRDPTIDGIKTGYHEAAGYCLAASALRDNMRLIAIVLGTDSENSRADAAAALLNYGFQFYETRRVFTANQPIKSVRVWKGDVAEVPLGLQRDLYVTVARGQIPRLRSAMQFTSKLVAPVAGGQGVGQLRVTLDGRVIAQRPVVALEAVSEAGLWGRTVDGIKLMFED